MRAIAWFGKVVSVYGEFVGRFFLALVVLLAGLNVVAVTIARHGLVGLFVSLVVTILAAAWAQATMVEDIRDRREGKGDASIGELYLRTWRVLGRIAWATFLASLAIGIVFGIALYFALLFVSGLGSLLIATAVAAFPALFLAARWSLIVPAIVIERRTTSAAFSRSTELVLPFRWTVFTVVAIGSVVAISSDLLLSFALASVTNGWLEAWLVRVVDGVVYSSFVVAISTTLYYELVGLVELHRPSRAEVRPWSPEISRLSR